MQIYPSPVYDLDELARYNLHVHTVFSGCARPEMTMAAICQAAEQAGLSVIALTDHYNDYNWDATYMEQIAQLKAAYAQTNSPVKVLFGSEFSCFGVGKWLENDETNQAMDYRLAACNHFHLDFWDKPEDASPRGYAEFAMSLVRSAMENRRYDCIAHPLHAGYVHAFRGNIAVMTETMTDNELGEIGTLSGETKTALELNTGAVLSDPVFYRRLWNLGKEAGAFFHYGTDAHQLHHIGTQTLLPRMKEALL